MKVSKNTLTRLFLCGAMVCALALQVGSSRAQQGPAAAGDNKITAIDILLEPDATMLRHSADNNARLLKVFPKGFALDATHRPHITLIQRFVRTADLDKVYGAAHRVLAAADVNAMLIASRILFHAEKLKDFNMTMAGLAVLFVLVILGPLAMFTPQLSRAKRRGLSEYGALATVYVAEFDEKWIGGGAKGEEILGTADIQSLADLANSYAVVKEMRLVPFGLNDVTRLAAATALPVVPLFLTIMPLEELVTRLLKIIF